MSGAGPSDTSRRAHPGGRRPRRPTGPGPGGPPDPVAPEPDPYGVPTDLRDVLRSQHADLDDWLGRLPELHGAARCDVFLHLRRRLAVHRAFEELVVRPRIHPQADDPAEEELALGVEAAEQLPVDSSAFDTAFDRVAAAHQRHTRTQEATVLPRLDGPLAPPESACVATVTQLWWGDGDVYLGNTYRQMVPAAREQLAQASDAPPPFER